MLGIETKTARHTWTAALVLLLIGVVYLLRQTLFVFAVALMLAYLLYPLFDLIERRIGSKKRTLALAITYILVIAAIGGFGYFIGTHVAGEARQLAAQIRKPGFQDHVRNWRLMNIPVGEMISGHYEDMVGSIPGITFKVLAASSNLIYLVIVPILSFLILKDGRTVRESFLEALDHGRQLAEDTLLDVHTLMLQYMRALLFLCLATLLAFSIALSAIGVPYAMLLAAIACPLEFIPMVGPLVSAVLIIAVSAVNGAGVVWVIVFLALYRMFQDYVLSPHLMSKGVALHPLLVIFGVFAGEEIGGIQGLFLSVPVLALLRLLYYRLRKARVATATRALV